MMKLTQQTAILIMTASLAACSGGGGGGGGGPNPTPLSASGLVTDQSNGAAISGALVDIKLSSTNPSGTTGSDGRYAVSLTSSGLPEFLVGSVNKTDYLPGTVFFRFANGKLDPRDPGSNNVALVPKDITKDVIFPTGLSVTHLGDGDFGGAANSKFQAPISGVIWKDSFTLTAAQKAANSNLTVTLLARGVESSAVPPYCDEIVLGNTLDGAGKVTLATPQVLRPSAADGSFTEITHVFPLAGLAADAIAYLQITSGKQCSTANTDFDDFEIATVVGKLTN